MKTRVMDNGTPAEAKMSPDFLFTSCQGTISATDLGNHHHPACEWPLLAQQITRPSMPPGLPARPTLC